MHILGPLSQFPLRNTRSLTPSEATVDDYMRVQKILGLERTVIVQPSSYAADNACTLNALAALGSAARAVVVIDPAISDSELAALHARGVRGVRLQSVVSGGASFDHLERLASRIQPFGWHLQLFMDADQIDSIANRVSRLPVDVVFDHMAYVLEGAPTTSAGFRSLLDLLQNGKTWVKLCSAFGPADGDRAQLLISHTPDRLVWGSDWPHLSYQTDAPDDGMLLDDLATWAGNEIVRRKILVDNPQRLYFS
jgi:predicted TIM-barrel fold metal-dependent hydrolase